MLFCDMEVPRLSRCIYCLMKHWHFTHNTLQIVVAESVHIRSTNVFTLFAGKTGLNLSLYLFSFRLAFLSNADMQ